MKTVEAQQLKVAAALLWEAHRALGNSDDALVRATAALTQCAAETASAICNGDTDSAHQAVASARAAVLTATYVSRALADSVRSAKDRVENMRSDAEVSSMTAPAAELST